jgi:hypothetical protein
MIPLQPSKSRIYRFNQSDKYLFPASQGFFEEKLMRKPQSLRKIRVDSIRRKLLHCSNLEFLAA